ncbi:MAG: phosphopantetheine-binding protein [Flavobacteriales bacterium]|nr:phosphopantetheine-binding protein [Flavobacteriales bacterium]
MNREEAQKIVISILQKTVDGLEMNDEKMKKTLVDLGVDSLDIMLVIMDIAEAANREISNDQAEGLKTPEKIVDFLAE